MDGGFTMGYNTYQPFNQVCYKGKIAQIHSTDNNINISYVENGHAYNIFVKEDEIEPILLNTELLNDLVGNSILGSYDHIVRFEAGIYEVCIEPAPDDSSWTISAKGGNSAQIKFLHELQNFINTQYFGKF